jgi:hypothetical protein
LLTAGFSTVAFLGLITLGCGEENPTPNPLLGGPQFKKGGMGGPGPSNPKIKAIMVKLGRGPGSLTPTIGKGIEADKPDWTALEPQAKEYAQLAADLLKEEPAKGSKESWEKFAGAYLKSAQNLEKAVLAKNFEDTRAAHGELAASCKSCHQEHRGGGGIGPGGFGGPGGPGGPGGNRPSMKTEVGPDGRPVGLPTDYPSSREAPSKSAPTEKKEATPSAGKSATPPAGK